MAGRVGLTRMWTRRRIAVAALGVADDPAHGVAGRDRPGAGELLARLEGDVGDLSRCDIDLIEGARAVGEHLNGVEVSLAARLDPRGAVGGLDPGDRLLRFDHAAAARRRPRRRNVQRPRPILGGHRRHRKRRHGLVVADLRWFARCASR